MKGGLGNLMKQAQKMQENMQRAQEELAKMEQIGEAGAGMVSVVLTGRHEVRRVKIDPQLFADNDVEMIEDLVAAAFNDAARKIEQAVKSTQADMTAGLNLPPGFKLPF